MKGLNHRGWLSRPLQFDEGPEHRASRPEAFQPSMELRDKLEKLSAWRISQGCLELSERTLDFHGGSASVSLARLSLCRSNEGIIIPSSRKSSEADVSQPDYVAVKKLKIADNTDLERVLRLSTREIELLVDLAHPNVIRLLGFVEEISSDVIWLVFPWEANGNVRDFLTGVDLEIPERISLIDDVAQGLEYLHYHEPPVCHGDLKSLNILVNPEYREVITDFGSARYLGCKPERKMPNESQATTTSTEANTGSSSPRADFSLFTKQLTVTGCLYTTRWAAPEILNGEESAVWSDIWAFGWICFEIMTNDFPFQGIHDTEVIVKVVQGSVPSVTDDVRMSPIVALCKLVTSCWTTSPNERPTAKECRIVVGWLPMIVPSPPQASDPGAPRARSPALLLEMARVHEEQGDYLSASKSCWEALRIYTSLDDEEGRAGALCCLGSVQRLEKDYNNAESSYSTALKIYARLGNDSGRADALWGLADTHRLQGEHGAAVSRYSTALKLYTSLGNDAGKAQALCGLAAMHSILRQYNNAISSYSKALRIYTHLRSEVGRAEVLWGLAGLHLRTRRFEKAISKYLEALEIYKSIGNQCFEADAIWALAKAYRLNADDDKAISFYSQVVTVCSKIGNEQRKVSALRGLATIHQYRKQYEEAISAYSQIFSIYTILGDDKGRADALQRKLEVYPTNGDQKGKAQDLWDLGHFYRWLKEYQKAAACYSGALEIYISLGDETGKADALRGLATVCRARGEHNEAFSRYSDAMQITVDLGDEIGRAKVLWGMAEVHCDTGDYRMGSQYYAQALQVCPDLGPEDKRAQLLWGPLRPSPSVGGPDDDPRFW